MNHIEYPYTMTDDHCLLYCRMDNGHDMNVRQLSGRDLMDFPLRVKEFLLERYDGSGYGVKRISIDHTFCVGENTATFYTTDHFVEEGGVEVFKCEEDLAGFFEQAAVCWSSCSFYYDLEE